MNQEQHEAYWRGYNDAKKYEQMNSAREWVGLTDEERLLIRARVQEYTPIDNVQYGLAVQHATEERLKEKNNGTCSASN